MEREAAHWLGLSAAHCARLTPGAILQLLEGYHLRERTRWRRTAWQTALLLNVSGKTVRSRITADGLLGLPDPIRSEPADDDQATQDAAGLAYVELMNAAFGGKDLRS